MTLGDVTVRVRRPDAQDVARNVELSSAALGRAGQRLMRAGVRLSPRKGVPLYSADADHPGLFIRRLDGKTERGVLDETGFRVVD